MSFSASPSVRYITGKISTTNKIKPLTPEHIKENEALMRPADSSSSTSSASSSTSEQDLLPTGSKGGRSRESGGLEPPAKRARVQEVFRMGVDGNNSLFPFGVCR